MKKADLLLTLASTLLSLLAVEVFLNHFANANSRLAIKVPGVHYDGRDWIDVVYDLEVAGIQAYPVVSADVYGQTFLDRNDPAALIPLAGMSNTTTTFCNELQEFIVYKSDRHGFRNDDRLWDSKTSVMLVGDSFGHGACVPDDATIAEDLTYDGLATLNAAYNSNGPLVELATLVEYGTAVKPPLVVWLYHEANDLTDLAREQEFPLLKKYLEPSFRQNLIARQTEIDGLIKAGLDARPEIQKAREAAKGHWSLSGLLQLRNIRALISDAWSGASEPAEAGSDGRPELDDVLNTNIPIERFVELESVLARAKQVVEGWGGRMLFVYLPASERYRFPDLPEVAVLPKGQAEVIRIATGLELPVVDLDVALRKTGNPAQLYPKANWPVHLTEEGYRVVSDAIAERLRLMSDRR